jgi:hypothetical protein
LSIFADSAPNRAFSRISPHRQKSPNNPSGILYLSAFQSLSALASPAGIEPRVIYYDGSGDWSLRVPIWLPLAVLFLWIAFREWRRKRAAKSKPCPQ